MISSRGGDRTRDLTIMSRALSPAELPCRTTPYFSVQRNDGRPEGPAVVTPGLHMAGAGFEPATFGL